MTSPRQLTIRNPSPELHRRLREIADLRGESLNATVLRLLLEAVGLIERRERLAKYATWNEVDKREFDDALSAQRAVDEDLWH